VSEIGASHQLAFDQIFITLDLDQLAHQPLMLLLLVSTGVLMITSMMLMRMWGVRQAVTTLADVRSRGCKDRDGCLALVVAEAACIISGDGLVLQDTGLLAPMVRQRRQTQCFNTVNLRWTLLFQRHISLF
jgi:hypothetical protein